MKILLLLFALSLCGTADGEYLAENPFSFARSRLIRTILSNSTCSPGLLSVITPDGITNETAMCTEDNMLHAVLSEPGEWWSSPGDSAVELRLGFRELEVTRLYMDFTSPLPLVLTVETVTSAGRNLLHVLVANSSLCANYPNTICEPFSSVTTSRSSSNIILDWGLSLGRTDVNTAAYLDVTIASGIVLTLSGYNELLVEAEHQYYGLAVLDVYGRCNCNGHSSSGSDIAEDTCSCLNCQHNTSGPYCDQCASGYQFSPWRRSTEDCPFVCQSDQCDVGGALTDVTCTSTSCTCRANIVGQYCDSPSEGFHVRSLHSVSVEAETGRIVQTGQGVSFGSNLTVFPDFQGRGYMDYYKPAAAAETIQWMVEIPVSTSYIVSFKYHLPPSDDERGFFDTLTVVKESQMYTSSISFSICDSPPCFTQSSEPSQLSLDKGIWAIQLHLNAKSVDTQLYMDSVILLPAAFLDASILSNSSQFVSDCNVGMDGLGTGGGVTNEAFCKSGVFSLSAQFFNGAFPCSCDVSGSNGTLCNPIGGQCPCYSPIAGNIASTNRDCSVCPYYYFGPGSEGCQTCGCAASDPLCDGTTGQCVCPTGVTGRSCDHCEDFTFGYDPVNGCTDCTCDLEGTSSCNSADGTCECKPLVDGVMCESCDTGAFNYTTDGCTLCGCDQLGSVDEECSEMGVCTCKSQVRGDKCDSCAPGSFYLSNTTSGCLSCICSGLNVTCSEFVGEYMSALVLGAFGGDLSGWVLVDGPTMQPLSQPPTVVNSETNTSTYLSISSTDLNLLTPGEVFWSLPQSLIMGTDWLLSYGGSLYFTLGIDGPVDSAEVILVSSNAVLFHLLSPLPSVTPQQYIVPLLESAWSVRTDGSHVTRAVFLGTLSALDSVLITALDSNSTASLLIDFSFDTAHTEGSRVLPIEQCACPEGYSGSSCDRCSTGYYRLNGACAPCACNGRSSTCQDNTGVCTGCTGNTAGDQCEVCGEGYFNVNYMQSGVMQCVECPCNESVSTRSTCVPVGNGTAQCDCNTGYTGLLCDMCDDGYHGNPPITPCFSCDCNGNIDPTVPGSCNQETGECLICQYNTMGSQCERCLDGYYGNASVQQCQECTCNVVGSKSLICDSTTGVCQCKANVIGSSCDSCQNETWNLASNSGCEMCGCDPLGSLHSVCDFVSGQCPCKPGVTGRQCDVCEDGYFSLSELGCTNCTCDPIGSVNASCHQTTGQCFCRPGIIGLQCDMCQPFFENLTSSGCESCGECVGRLSTLLQMATDNTESSMVSVDNIVSLRAADVEGLTNISTLSEEVAIRLNNSQTSLNSLYSMYNALFAATSNETLKLSGLQLELVGLDVLSQETADKSDQRLFEVTFMETQISTNLASTADLHYYLTLAYQEVQALEVESGNLVANITRFYEDVLNISFNMSGLGIESDYSYVQTLLLMAERARELSLIQDQQANDLNAELVMVNSSNTRADILIGGITNTVSELENIELDVANTSRDIDYTSSVVESSLNGSVDTIATAEEIVRNAQTITARIRDNIEELRESLQDQVPDSNVTASPSTLSQSISELESSLTALLSFLSVVEEDVNSAERHGHDITSGGGAVESVLQPSLAVGRNVVGIITEYQQVMDNIAVAANLSEVANTTAYLAMERANQLINMGYLTQARAVYQATLTLQEDINAFVAFATDTLQRAEEAEGEAERASGLLGEIREAENMVKQLAMRLESITGPAIIEIDQAIQTTFERTTCVSNGYSNIQSLVSGMLTNVSGVQTVINEVENLVQNISDVANDARSLVSDARRNFEDRVSIMDQIVVERNLSQNLHQNAQSMLSNLQTRLSTIRDAASRLSVAVRLDGNTTLAYQSAFSQSDYVSISLFFRSSENSTGTLLSVPTPSGHSLAITMSLSSLSFSYPVSELITRSADMGQLLPNVWYHLLASQDVGGRNASRLRLSLAQIGGGDQWTTSEDVESSQTGILSQSTVVIGGDMNDHFSGCVDSLNINDVPLPLLVPDTPPEYAIPCGPRPPVETARLFENGTWFIGGGFIEVAAPVQAHPNVTVDLWFRTFAATGLLFHATGVVNPMQRFSLYLHNGQVALEYAISGMDAFVVSTMMGNYNDGGWHQVNTRVTGQRGTISIDGGIEEVTGSALVAITMETLNLLPTVYLGGLPPEVRTSSPLEVPLEFSGCLRDVVVNSKALPLTESSVQNHARVEFNGCPQDVISGVRFMGEGLAEFTPVGEPVYHTSFLFKTEQLVGVMLDIQPLQVSVYHTHVHVTFGAISVETLYPGYSDNDWHSVTIRVSSNQLELVVDGAVSALSVPIDVNSTNNSVVIAGFPYQLLPTLSSSMHIADSFRGCIRDLYINNRQIDFRQARTLVNVALYGCRPARVVTPTATLPPPSMFTSSSADIPLSTTMDVTTLPMIDGTPTTLVEDTASPLVTPTSVIEHTPTSVIEDTPTSLIDETSSSMMVVTSTSMIEDTPTSVIDETSSSVTPTSVFEDTPTSLINETSSSVMVVTPTSLIDETSSSMMVVTPTSVIEDTPTSVIDETSSSVIPTSVFEDTLTSIIDETSSSVTPTSVFEDTLTSVIDETSSSFTPTSVFEDTLTSVIDETFSSVMVATSTSVIEDTPTSLIEETSSSVIVVTRTSVIEDTPTSVIEDTPTSLIDETSSSVMVVTPTSVIDETSVIVVESTSVIEDTPTSIEDMPTSLISIISTLPVADTTTPTSDILSLIETPTSRQISLSMTMSVSITAPPTILPSPSATLPLLPLPPPLPPPLQSVVPSSSLLTSAASDFSSVEVTSTILVSQPTGTVGETSTVFVESSSLTSSVLPPQPTSVVEETPSTFIQSSPVVTSSELPPQPTSVVEETPSTFVQTSPVVTSSELPPQPTSVVEETPSTFVQSSPVVTSSELPPQPTSVVEETPSTFVQSSPVDTSSELPPQPTSVVEETPSTFIQSSPMVTSSALPPQPTSVVEETPSTSVISTSSMIPMPTPEPITPGLFGEFGSYLQYTLPVGYLKRGFNITLQFRSLSSEGILLFIGNGSDFMSLELRGGILVFYYRLGGGTALMESGRPYSDGIYHTVVLYREGVDGAITVDGTDARLGRSPGDTYTGLDVINLPLYVGGVPRDMVPRGILGPGEVSRPSVVGCFSQLIVNRRTLDLSSPDSREGAFGCPSVVSNVASFGGSGYVQLMDSWFPGERFEVSLQFRTTVCDGILFYLANTDIDNGDYILLELVDGRICFTFYNGGPSAVIMENGIVNKTEVCSNAWVDVLVTKSGGEGEVKVNGMTVQGKSSVFDSVDAAHPLYIGGVADNVRAEQNIVSPPFMGCIRNVTLTNYGRQITPLFMQASSSVNTTIGSC